MIEETNPPESRSEEAGSASPVATAAFPDVPFPCPNCGQMLAPSCRVCVACKQTIDPAEIGASAEAQVATSASETTEAAAAIVRFPWLLFFVLFSIRIAATGLGVRRWGLIRDELVVVGVDMLCSAWVFYDASRAGVPRPLRWALGTLLLWPVVFPWYLVRRKTPRARCPFVEGIGLPVVLLVLLVLGVLATLIVGPPK